MGFDPLLCAAPKLTAHSCLMIGRLRPSRLTVLGLRLTEGQVKLSLTVELGVGDGSRTHNFQIHSLALCQLNYTHRARQI